MELAPNSQPWGERVMHVLAQVPAPPGLPASLYDAGYAAFVAEHLGPARDRALGKDLAALAALLGDHASLVAVQGLAVRYRDVTTARAEADRDLRELGVTSALLGVEPAAELLRASALLEAPHHDRLPPARLELEALDAALRELLPIAPALAHARVVPMRPLGGHGRLFGDEIWVGVPGALGGPAPTELAMQAAHEASVAEARATAGAAGLGLDERAVEGVALVLLATRAGQTGRTDPHRRWYARWSTDARWLEPGALDATQRELLERCTP
jgi:hypothetical protein